MTAVRRPPMKPAEMTEKALQAAVIDLARSLGWGVTQSASKAMATEAEQYGVPVPPLEGLIFHPRYSLGSEPGWPDLTLIRRRDQRLIFAELKAQKGVLSKRQAEVMDLLRAIVGATNGREYRNGGYAGPPRVEVHLWRPSDLAAGTITDVLR